MLKVYRKSYDSYHSIMGVYWTSGQVQSIIIFLNTHAQYKTFCCYEAVEEIEEAVAVN